MTMEKNATDILISLFEKWAGAAPSQVEAITEGGSARQYFRLTLNEQRAIGCIGVSKAENDAFLAFTEHFQAKGMQVPNVYAIAENHSHS